MLDEITDELRPQAVLKGVSQELREQSAIDKSKAVTDDEHKHEGNGLDINVASVAQGEELEQKGLTEISEASFQPARFGTREDQPPNRA